MILLDHPRLPTREILEIIRGELGLYASMGSINAFRRRLGVPAPKSRDNSKNYIRHNTDLRILPENRPKAVVSRPPTSLDYDEIQRMRHEGITIVHIARHYRVDVLQVLRYERDVERHRYLATLKRDVGKTPQ